MKVIISTCLGAGFDPEAIATGTPLNLGYKAMLGLIEQLKACAEVTATRTNNWQAYCLEEKSEGALHPFLPRSLPSLPIVFQKHEDILSDQGQSRSINQFLDCLVNKSDFRF